MTENRLLIKARKRSKLEIAGKEKRMGTARRVPATMLVMLMLAAVIMIAPAGAGAQEIVIQAGGAAFLDLPSNHWASGVVTKMYSKGILKGYEEAGGTYFKPDNQVTRLEAVVMIVNMLGWEELAKTKQQISSELVNREFIPNWAVGHVAVAVDKGIIPESDLLNFRHNEPAKRHEAAIFLVRGAGLARQAQDKMQAAINYVDAGEVPAASRGYLAVAVEKGFMAGSDGALLPLNPVTRAQMAALLTKVDEYLDGQQESIIGTIDKVEPSDYGHILTITLPNGVKRLVEVTGKAEVLLDNKRVTVDSLTAGQQADIAVRRNQVAKVEVSTNLITTYTGRVVAVEVAKREITIEEADKSRRVIAIPSSVQLWREGKKAEFTEVKLGDQLEVQMHKSGLMLAANVRVVMFKLKGTVWGAASAPQPVVWVQTDTGLGRYGVAQDAVVKKNGSTVLLDQLQEGDLVELEVLGDTVYSLAATSVKTEVNGSFKSVIALTGDVKEVKLVNSKGQEESYRLAAEVSIIRGGKDIEVKDIAPGDYVKLHLTSNLVTKIEVVQYELVELVGVISSVNVVRQVVSLRVVDGPAALSGEINIVIDSSQTKIFKRGQETSLDSLKKDDRVEITVFQEEGVYVASKVIVLSS